MTCCSRSALLTGFVAGVAGAAGAAGAVLPRIVGAQTAPVRIAGVFSDLFASRSTRKDGFGVRATKA